MLAKQAFDRGIEAYHSILLNDKMWELLRGNPGLQLLPVVLGHGGAQSACCLHAVSPCPDRSFKHDNEESLYVPPPTKAVQPSCSASAVQGTSLISQEGEQLHQAGI